MPRNTAGIRGAIVALATVFSLGLPWAVQAQDKQTLLNVSYDPTRELYRAVDEAFIKEYQARAGVDLTVRQSHGGSGRQARSVIDGLDADVVTLALAYDIDAIADRGLLPQDWQKRLPRNSSPYTSTIVFLVRKGNPRQIHDWDDLVKDGVQVITPNPKTSAARAGITWRPGPMRWRATRAAKPRRANSWASCSAMCRCWIRGRAARPPRSSSAAWATCCWPGKTRPSWRARSWGRTNSTSWCRRCPSWPNRLSPWWTRWSTAGTCAAAQAYLEYLYTPAAQEIIARNFYRPTDAGVAAKYASRFPKLKLVTIDDPIFGGWRKAQKDHFSDGGTFDQVYQPQRK